MGVPGVVRFGNKYYLRAFLVQFAEHLDGVLFHFGHVAHLVLIGRIYGIVQSYTSDRIQCCHGLSNLKK